jgi:hypothetical protein
VDKKMGFGKYNKEYYSEERNKRKFGKKTFIFLVFLFVLVIILFSAFYSMGGITGNTIDSINNNNSVQIKTSFSVPEINLNGDYTEVTLFLNRGTIIKMDNKKINLEEDENKIILKNFKGEININEDYLTKINGKVDEIKINNLPLTLQERGKIKVSISENSRYSFFEIEKGVYLKNIFFTTSGTLNFEEDILNLNSEKVEIKNYLGKLTIKDKKLILEGFVESLNLESSSRKLSLSK